MARHIVGKTSLILDTGRLVRPGDPVAALDGDRDPIQEGHTSKARWRWNKYTWDWKFFDPRQIFFSPTIRYCELPHYAIVAYTPCVRCDDKNKRVLHVTIHVAKVVLPSYNVFKVRVSVYNWRLANLGAVQVQPTVYMAGEVWSKRANTLSKTRARIPPGQFTPGR